MLFLFCSFGDCFVCVCFCLFIFVSLCFLCKHSNPCNSRVLFGLMLLQSLFLISVFGSCFGFLFCFLFQDVSLLFLLVVLFCLKHKIRCSYYLHLVFLLFFASFFLEMYIFDVWLPIKRHLSKTCDTLKPPPPKKKNRKKKQTF